MLRRELVLTVAQKVKKTGVQRTNVLWTNPSQRFGTTNYWTLRKTRTMTNSLEEGNTVRHGD